MSDEDLDRWIAQQEALPEHLKRWAVFERPQWIWLARWLGYVGLHKLGGRICGLRGETNEERAERLRKFWQQEEQDGAHS